MTLMIPFTACDIDISLLYDKYSMLKTCYFTLQHKYISYIAILSYLYIRKTVA